MQPLLWPLLLASVISCSSENKKQAMVLRQPVAPPVKDSLENYSVTRQKVISLRDSLRLVYQTDSLENIFTHAVVDKLIVHWYFN